MNKSYAVFMVIVAAGLGAIIYVEANTISALTDRVGALTKQEAALRTQAKRDQDEIKDLQAQLALFRETSESMRKQLADGTATVAPQGAASADAPAPEAGGASKGAWMKGLAKMFTDPAMKKSMKAQQAVGIRMMYGDLFKKLGLSPQDSEQLADILAERQMELSGVAMSAMTGDGQPDPSQSQKIADARQHYEEQLKATLGDTNYQKLQDYEKTMGDRFMMQQFEGQFATAGAPLEPAQRETLLNIMADERLKTPETPFSAGNANPQAQLEALKDPAVIDQYFAQQEAMNRRVLARARQTFSADQIVALEKIQQQTIELQRGQMKMSQEFLGK